MAQREPARARERPRGTDEQPRRRRRARARRRQTRPRREAPARSEAACQEATATSPARTSTPAATCTQSMRAVSAPKRPSRRARLLRLSRDSPPRRSEQRLHPPHFEQRHEREQQRHQQPDGHALRDGRRGQAVRRRRRATPTATPGISRIAAAARATPSQAAGQPEQRDLQHVDREDLRGGRAEALEDRDAPDLLPDEDARHAPHADAAEHDDDEADEAQVVLGANRGRRRCRPRVRVRARRRRTRSRNSSRSRVVKRLDAVLAHPEQPLIARAAAEAEQARLLQIGAGR